MAATQYRIFLATPGDLQKERQLVRDFVAEYNRLTPAAAAISFGIIGWEDLGRGLGNPEEQILVELRQCDYLVLLLGARWGTAPGGAAGYTSGTEAEFYEAVNRYNDPAAPMRGISVFFRAVNQQAMADPGPQLQRVIEFRKHLEAAQEIFYGDFDDDTSLRRRIERQLAEWTREVAAGAPRCPPTPVKIARPAAQAPAIQAPAVPPTCADAEKLIAQGRFTEADTLFANLTADETDLESMIVYGRFLRDRGKFARATGLFTRVLEIAEIQQDGGHQAVAVENLGKIERRRNRLDEAEALFRRAIELFTQLGGEAGALGVARQYGQLGLVARMRGSCEQALELHEKAEQIFYKQLDIEGIAKQHSRKGKVYQAMGDLARAEEHFRNALDAELKLGLSRNIAVVAGHLTSNYLLQGKLDQAEEPLRLCLERNQAVGDSWGLATCDRYRGWIELERGNHAAARQYLQQAEQAYRRMGILRDLDDARALLARLK